MRRMWLVCALLLVPVMAQAKTKVPKDAAWYMNASVIEACSCPMFCQCYFNTGPSGHAAEMEHHSHGDAAAASEGHAAGADHFCKFNNAYKVNKGYLGKTKLDGAMFWIYGDLGGDFSKGEMDWAVVTFDKATTPEQRKAIGEICASLFPVKWNSLTTGEGSMKWNMGKEQSVALLDDGKTAEVRLDGSKLARNDASQQMVLNNLKYWGANSNDGFVMMPNVVQGTHVGDKPFEYKGTNGFLVTFDIYGPAAAKAGGTE